MDYYLKLKGEQVGPYQKEDIQGWLNAGHVKLDDLAWYEGCSNWIKIHEIPDIKVQVVGHASDSDLTPPFDAYEGSEPFIFISYAHKDSELVYKEILELHQSGYKIWYDEGIEASNEWPEEIANAVIGCAVFLVFISPRSTASVNCRNEINLALNEGKPFLAVHLEESNLPPGLRLRMGDLQAILRFRLTRDRYLKKIHGTLDQLLGIKSKADNTECIEGLKQAPVEPSGKVMAQAIQSDSPRSKSWVWASAWFIPLVFMMLGLFFWISQSGTTETVQETGTGNQNIEGSDKETLASNVETTKPKSSVTGGASVSIRSREKIKIESMQEGQSRLYDSKPIRKIEGFSRRLYNWQFTSIPQRKVITYEVRVQKEGYIYCFGNPGSETKVRALFKESYSAWEAVKDDIRGRMIVSCFRKYCEVGEVLHLTGFEIQLAAKEIGLGP